MKAELPCCRLGDSRIFHSFRWLLASSCVGYFFGFLFVFLTHLISSDMYFLCIIPHPSLEISLKPVLKKHQLHVLHMKFRDQCTRSTGEETNTYCKLLLDSGALRNPTDM